MTQAPDAALLRIENLEAGYREPVMRPLTMRIDPGERVGLRGPNGAGKSTLLRAIGGTARIFAGRIARREGLRVAHQHQNPLPLDSVPLSGEELLALTGATTEDLPEWITPLIDRRLSKLSGGQLQFLQVWAALQAPADLVLLDEPTNNLDRQGIAFLQNVMRRPRERKAVLLVSHEPGFLEAVSDRIVEMAP